MSDVKVKHNKNKKSSFDIKAIQTDISPLRKVITNYAKNREALNLETTNKTDLKGSQLSSTNPSLIKLVKTADPSYFDDKPNQENDIKEIINKYEEKNKCDAESQINSKIDQPFNFEREEPNRMGETPRLNLECEIVKNKEACPIINFNNQGESLNFEEHILDPTTERECSFINNISVNHSNFFEDDNKNQEVVLCVSNLDIEPDLGKKVYLNTNLNNNQILQSEEKLIHKKELEILSKELSDMSKTDKKNLISNENKKQGLKWIYWNLFICIVFVAVLSILLVVLFFIIKGKS